MKIYKLFTIVLVGVVLFACKKEEEKTNSSFGVVKEHASEIKFQFYMNDSLMDFRENSAYSNLSGPGGVKTNKKTVNAKDAFLNSKYSLHIDLVDFNGVGTYDIPVQNGSDYTKNRLGFSIDDKAYMPFRNASFIIEEYDETTKLIKGKFEAKYLSSNDDTISITGGEFYIGQVSISSAEAGKK